MQINPQHHFILNNGTTIGSLEELVKVLKNIDKEIFEFHVNDQKNDFANWIRYVFKSSRLSDNISGFDYSQRSMIIKSINNHLAERKMLVVNAGSSSLKFQLIELTTRDILFKGVIDAIGLSNCTMQITTHGTVEMQLNISTHQQAVEEMILQLQQSEVIGDTSEIRAVVHRVVHGGELFSKPTQVNDEVLDQIESLSSLAPLHNPHNVSCIKACMRVMPQIPQVAVFDTAFHSTINNHKFLYGLPYELYEKHAIRKYGFHGSSHKYIANLMQEYYKIKKQRNPKIVICHLGNGCSITAVKDGKSFNTSMGFTPTDGLIMGTRSGNLDPYIAVHLEKVMNMNFDELGKMLNKQSGLLGICGYSDMRMIWGNKKDPRCNLAREMFADRIIHYIGAYAAEMNGIDAIVFTAGIGENAFYIRKRVIDNLGFLGAKLDEKKNAKNEFIISAKGSRVECFVIKTNEELQMALEAKRLLKI